MIVHICEDRHICLIDIPDHETIAKLTVKLKPALFTLVFTFVLPTVCLIMAAVLLHICSVPPTDIEPDGP